MRRFRGSKSSVYNHLLASPDCCNSYSDSSFTVLCRGRHGYGLQLKVLEAIYQRLYKPNWAHTDNLQKKGQIENSTCVT